MESVDCQSSWLLPLPTGKTITRETFGTLDLIRLQQMVWRKHLRSMPCNCGDLIRLVSFVDWEESPTKPLRRSSSQSLPSLNTPANPHRRPVSFGQVLP